MSGIGRSGPSFRCASSSCTARARAQSPEPKPEPEPEPEPEPDPDQSLIVAVGAVQVLGFRGGSRNYSIFQRRDGLLFLYSEIDEAQAARDQVHEPHKH